MATVPKPRRSFLTFDEVQEVVGHVPDWRIRVRPAPGQATEADLLEIHRKEGRLYELIDGILVEKVVATYQARLAGVLMVFLELFQKQTGQKIGATVPGDGPFRIFPGRIRIPDLSFVYWKNMPGGRFPNEPIASLVPDLAVEVLSESNTAQEMERKVREYFEGGCQLVWIVDPTDRSVRVHTSPDESTLLTENQSVSGGEVLPGFSLSIREWFAEAEGAE
jgi:Uma2 family endonuclease